MSEDKNHSEQFEKYLKSQMTSQEANAFEREVLDDPFSMEALEGFEEQGLESLKDLKSLRNQVSNKRKAGFVWLRYASVAMVILASLFGVYFFLNQIEDGKELAMSDEKEEESTSPPKPDTTQIEEKTVSEVEKKDFEQGALKVEKEDKSLIADLDEEIEDEFYKETQEAIIEEIPNLQTQTAGAGMAETLELEPIEAEPQLAQADTPLEIESIEETAVEAQPMARSRIAEDMVSNTQETKAKKSVITGAVSRSMALVVDAVSGTVTNETGEPLPGVNVIIKGTTSGTQTDLNGNYILEDAQGATLTYSFVGFESQEVEVGSRSTIDITMGGAMELQEVVVTGYGVTDNNLESSYSPASPLIGNKEYKSYLEETLQYPESALENEIEGTVVLQLTISSDGSIKNIEVRRSLGYGCDEEAIHLVREGPEWVSAERDGVNVEDKVRVRVRFKL